MFDWLRRKTQPKPDLPKTLYFKSPSAAFEYACKYMPSLLIPTRTAGSDAPPIIGFVHSRSNGPMGDDTPSFMKKQQQPYFEVSLAIEGVAQQVGNCGTLATDQSDIESMIGQLVLVDIGSYDPKHPIRHMFNYFIILGRLKPELVVENHSFVIDKLFL